MSTVVTALLLTAAAVAYLRGVAVLWARGGADAGVGRGRAFAYLLGLATLAVALLSPLEALAHATFAMHMTQHVLLVLIAPPLLVAGAPWLPFLWTLPRGPRRRLVRAGTAPTWRGAWRVASRPLVVWTIATATLWTWHLPSLYEAALARPSLHALEHATLLGSSLLLWWLVLRPLGRPRAAAGVALLVVFATKVQSTILVALILFAPDPLYPTYAAGLAAVGRTPMEDQQLAGLIMGAPMALVHLAAAAILFVGWLRAIERRTAGAASVRASAMVAADAVGATPTRPGVGR